MSEADQKKNIIDLDLQAILRRFVFPEHFSGKDPFLCEPFGNGHINDTFRVTLPGSGRSYVLQRINRNVFHHPDQVMENVVAVTGWIRKKLSRPEQMAELLRQSSDEAAQKDGMVRNAAREAAQPPRQEVLQFLPAEDGRWYVRDLSGEYWRICDLIDHAVCYETAENEDIFYQSALAFGRFQQQLSDFPAEKLYETIPHFHDTPSRYRDFLEAVEADRAGRLKEVREEVEWIRSRQNLSSRLTDAQKAGKLPLRVTHNDTKLNNVMIDSTSGKAICVLDLDTVMPGLSVTDFGDAIRFGASTALEDEPALSRVHFDHHLYDVYRQGFLEGCRDALTPGEIRSLPDGALVITFEQAIRFLGDYLNGDTYYKTTRPGQNLDRARTQIRLLMEMEQQLPRP